MPSVEAETLRDELPGLTVLSTTVLTTVLPAVEGTPATVATSIAAENTSTTGDVATATTPAEDTATLTDEAATLPASTATEPASDTTTGETNATAESDVIDDIDGLTTPISLNNAIIQSDVQEQLVEQGYADVIIYLNNASLTPGSAEIEQMQSEVIAAFGDGSFTLQRLIRLRLRAKLPPLP